jgi:hypothetical protein
VGLGYVLYQQYCRNHNHPIQHLAVITTKECIHARCNSWALLADAVACRSWLRPSPGGVIHLSMTTSR